MKTTVVNLRKEPFDGYFGRPGKGQDGYFGNPFRKSAAADGSIDAVLEDFRWWFASRLNRDPVFKRRVLELRGKRLGCFCKPGPCHGDIIAEWIDAQPEEQR